MPTPKEMVDLLNEFVKAAPKTAHDLIEHRESCPEAEGYALGEHPTIILAHTAIDEYRQRIGVLGLLNGIAGLDGKVIEAVYDDATERLTGFRLRGDN